MSADDTRDCHLTRPATTSRLVGGPATLIHPMTDHEETKLDRPQPLDRTAILRDDYMEVAVDDLPAPAVIARQVDVAALIDTLRYQLHRVEAQVVSAGRELIQVAVARPDAAPGIERALHLVTASTDATRRALRVLQTTEARHRLGASEIG